MNDHQYDGINEAEIRRRVQQRLNELVELYIHLTIYIVANLAMWALWFITGGFGQIPQYVPIMITLGWGIGLVAHGAKVYFTRAMDNIRDQEVDRALERERQRRGLYGQKRKNDNENVTEPTLRLSDDGELIPTDQEDELPPRRNAKTR